MSLTQILPREHGTWAMLVVPLAVGWGVARRGGMAPLLLSIGALLFFLAHNQIMEWCRLGLRAAPEPGALRATRRRIMALAALGAIALAPLLLGPRPGLLAFGVLAVALTAASAWLVRHRSDRGLPGQVLAAVGLPLGAPAAWYVAGGPVDRRPLALWLLNALFFLGAVLYVRLKIEALANRSRVATAGGRLAFALPTLALDAVILVSAWGALRLGGFSPLALLAFAPTGGQALAGVARLHRPAVLKRVGLIATAHSVLFALLLVWLA
ncbi:MAG TPA: YwiC-like family protein [Methylomirabilota bacterium]|nr:YwiC-like family protein [Methylomirabilota bacterium]